MTQPPLSARDPLVPASPPVRSPSRRLVLLVLAAHAALVGLLLWQWERPEARPPTLVQGVMLFGSTPAPVAQEAGFAPRPLARQQAVDVSPAAPWAPASSSSMAGSAAGPLAQTPVGGAVPGLEVAAGSPSPAAMVSLSTPAPSPEASSGRPGATASGSGAAAYAPSASAGAAFTPPRTDATLFRNPQPPYPTLSRRRLEKGTVLLDVYILADGTVGQVRLHQSSGFPRLDAAAQAGVRHWRYLPARRGSEPVPWWYEQPIVFGLDP